MNPLDSQEQYPLKEKDIPYSIQQLEEQLLLLVQQLILGLPIEPLLTAYPQITHWLKQLQTYVPEIFTDSSEGYFEITPLFQTFFDRSLLEVQCQGAIFQADRLKLINWSISPPQSLEEIRRDWSTSLTLFVAAQNSGYSPDKISFHYWFLTLEAQPIEVHFNYTQAEFDCFKASLEQSLMPTPFLEERQLLSQNYLNSIPEIPL